jgi:hypothetical protein
MLSVAATMHSKHLLTINYKPTNYATDIKLHRTTYQHSHENIHNVIAPNHDDLYHLVRPVFQNQLNHSQSPRNHSQLLTAIKSPHLYDLYIEKSVRCGLFKWGSRFTSDESMQSPAVIKSPRLHELYIEKSVR